MVIEKGGAIGNHGLSGAIVDPKSLYELFPGEDITTRLDAAVSADEMWYLTHGRKLSVPFLPAPLNNHGKYVASLNRLTKWLAEKAEAAGADVFAAFPGQELLRDGERVIGERIGDKGIAASTRTPTRPDTTICADRCTEEYGNPCQYFCPAAVYEPQFERSGDIVIGMLQLNFANCVHCKTCDTMDPYQIITWVPPQGGEGPVYTGL